MTTCSFFAPAPLGIERLLAEEILSLGASNVRPARAGVEFSGELAVGYRVCLWSRTASRVLLRLAEVPASSPEELYEGVNSIAWEDHVPVTGSIAVDFTGSKSPITHSHYGALKVKDAIVDRFRARTGVRPDVDILTPDLKVNVVARLRSAVISIDLSGDALHRRGYRVPGVQVTAPLKESLAAAVLLFSKWPQIAAQGGPLIDPVCGSGTLLIEGAAIAGDRAPGLLRSRWGFDGWLGHDPQAWSDLLDEADTRAEEGVARIPPVFGWDIDPRAVALANECVRRAGLERYVSIRRGEALEASPPQSAVRSEDGVLGLLAMNPPYGQRLKSDEGPGELYALLGARAREAFPGYRLAMIAPEAAPAERIGVPAIASHDIYNGRIPAKIHIFELPRPVLSGVSLAASPDFSAEVISATESAFANRLRKNARHLRSWAKRSGVSCYRLYDADIPEYAVSVDRYEGAGPDAGRVWACVAEYAPPRTIDPAVASRRLAEVVAVVPEVLGIGKQDVFVKVRKKQSGRSQYERMGERQAYFTVAEGGLLFHVNLSDYLDTGLFLDHRITREMLRERSSGKRFLNLFSYTGAASVYAASGGAAATVSVDMSATYLQWSEKNMAANGFSGDEHVRIRADVLACLFSPEAKSLAPFDLIFCDPPTFSNSKRMEESFDVQRDHIRLLTAAAELLAPDGVIVFSNNMRKFKMDLSALEGSQLLAENITAETIPKDFERNKRIHNVWRISRASR